MLTWVQIRDQGFEAKKLQLARTCSKVVKKMSELRRRVRNQKHPLQDGVVERF